MSGDMEQIVLETPESLPEAVAFANRQFGTDFMRFQPKLYCHADAGATYTLRKDGIIAGMLSVYPSVRRGVRFLSVGTVCTDPEFRGQGVMSALFGFLQDAVFPHYDIIALSGRRERYEHFGFAKAVWFPEYWFYPENCETKLRISAASKQDASILLDCWTAYGSGIERSLNRMPDILQSANQKAYLLSDGRQFGYIAANCQKRRITEYCGPWPAEMAMRTLSSLWGGDKIGILGSFNCHDPALLAACDSYCLHNHGNIRMQAMQMGLQETYAFFGHGGSEPAMKLPSSLFYLDGI